MSDSLSADRKIGSYTIRIGSVCSHVFLIHCQNQRKVTSRRMTGNKDTILATAILFDIPECPCHGFGGIFYISRILCFRTQTIINRHYCKALIRQFLGNKFTSSFHTTAMKAYNG